MKSATLPPDSRTSFVPRLRMFPVPTVLRSVIEGRSHLRELLFVSFWPSALTLKKPLAYLLKLEAIAVALILALVRVGPPLSIRYPVRLKALTVCCWCNESGDALLLETEIIRPRRCQANLFIDSDRVRVEDECRRS